MEFKIYRKGLVAAMLASTLVTSNALPVQAKDVNNTQTTSSTTAKEANVEYYKYNGYNKTVTPIDINDKKYNGISRDENNPTISYSDESLNNTYAYIKYFDKEANTQKEEFLEYFRTIPDGRFELCKTNKDSVLMYEKDIEEVYLSYNLTKRLTWIYYVPNIKSWVKAVEEFTLLTTSPNLLLDKKALDEYKKLLPNSDNLKKALKPNSKGTATFSDLFVLDLNNQVLNINSDTKKR